MRKYRVLGKPDMIAAARDISASARQLGVNEQAELVINHLAGDETGSSTTWVSTPNGLPATLVLSRDIA